jgi:hypothetical protein
MTRREIFLKIKAHLLAQGRKAERERAGTPECRYRTEDGLSCAVGCLIPKNAYDERMEGVPVRHVGQPPTVAAWMLRDALMAAGVDCDDDEIKRLLVSMQSIHDDNSSESWPERLEQYERQNFTEETTC